MYITRENVFKAVICLHDYIVFLLFFFFSLEASDVCGISRASCRLSRLTIILMNFHIASHCNQSRLNWIFDDIHQLYIVSPDPRENLVRQWQTLKFEKLNYFFSSRPIGDIIPKIVDGSKQILLGLGSFLHFMHKCHDHNGHDSW